MRYTLRTLFRSPFVTIVAIVSLGLGIGANGAIFSIFNQLLLQPLPVSEPGRLVNLSAPGPMPGSTSCNNAGSCDVIFSYPMFRDLQREQTPFTDLAAHRSFGANLAFEGQTITGEGMLVSGGYFGVLGLHPALGRLIGPEDDRVIGESPVVVLSHAYWRTRFDGRPDIVNQTMVVNGRSLTIVGVAPPGFRGTTLGTDPEVFVPITMRAALEPNFNGFENRQSYWIYLFGRLKPGVSIDEARIAINMPYRNIINEVEAPLQRGMSDQTMARFRSKEVVLEEGARGQSSVHRQARQPLMMLLGVTALVLVIACANIANLLLARGAGRSTEMAIRLSLGAGRRQLVLQLLGEACLLAVLGGAAGLLVARWTLDLIASILPSFASETFSVQLDWTVVLFASALALGTGVLFGLFPAVHSTRPDLLPALKGSAGQPSGARSAKWFRNSLATAQIALSMALLVAAGLFTRSLYNIARVDLGLDVESLVTFRLSPRLNGYTPERARVLFERLEEELASQPGIRAVTASLVPALANSNWGNDVAVEGFESGPDIDSNSRFNAVGPGYFRTMGIPILAGREFTPADTLGAPRVAIVNEAFAKKFNLGRNAVGKRIGAESGDSSPLDTEIVGLVADAKYSQVKADVPPIFFRPYRQDDALGSMSFYVRSAVRPDAIMTAIRSTVGGLDPNLPVDRLRTMEEQVRENVYLDRFISILSAAFATLATILAAVGLYGVLAYTVAQRTREIGLRMALGAAPGRVRRMVLRQVAVMTLIGAAIGLTAAVWIGAAAEALLFQMEGTDMGVLAGAAAVLTLVALLAGFVPAHRASRIDPMRALRYE